MAKLKKLQLGNLLKKEDLKSLIKLLWTPEWQEFSGIVQKNLKEVIAKAIEDTLLVDTPNEEVIEFIKRGKIYQENLSHFLQSVDGMITDNVDLVAEVNENLSLKMERDILKSKQDLESIFGNVLDEDTGEGDYNFDVDIPRME